MWPFSKNHTSSREQAQGKTKSAAPTNEQKNSHVEHREDTVAQFGRDFGPFDADSVDLNNFDFSDFSDGGLDLSSILIPVPQGGEVQVEMGTDGPVAMHVVTPLGRLTPIAFSDTKTATVWEEQVPILKESLESEGADVRIEQGPWGQEILAETPHGVIYVLGASGDRWMFRLTASGSNNTKYRLKELARDVATRSFVRRGAHPLPPGQVLPVILSEAMVADLHQAIEDSAKVREEYGKTPDEQ